MNDDRVADYRGISEAELLRRRGVFVAEGRWVVERLIDDGFSFRSLLLNAAAQRALEPALTRLPQNIPVYVCNSSDFRELTGFNLHRGCLGFVERPAPRDYRDLLSPARVILVLEGVANADNIGGIFRNAAAFGVDAVLMDDMCADPLYRKAIRTSMSASLRVPFARFGRWPDDLRDLRAAGFVIIALTPSEPSEPLGAFASGPLPERIAVLVGAEGPGLTATALASADLRVRIPTTPRVDSLNVAVAAGILLARLSERAALWYK